MDAHGREVRRRRGEEAFTEYQPWARHSSECSVALPCVLFYRWWKHCLKQLAQIPQPLSGSEFRPLAPVLQLQLTLLMNQAGEEGTCPFNLEPQCSSLLPPVHHIHLGDANGTGGKWWQLRPWHPGFCFFALGSKFILFLFLSCKA